MGEPKFGEPLTGSGCTIFDRNNRRVAAVFKTDNPHYALWTREFVRRFNALSGIDHPEALPALLETVRRAVAAHIGCGLGIAYRALFDEAPKAKEELK